MAHTPYRLTSSPYACTIYYHDMNEVNHPSPENSRKGIDDLTMPSAHEAPDGQLLVARYNSIMHEMGVDGLDEDRVHELFDEAESLFALDKQQHISEKMRDEFYRLNHLFFQIVDDAPPAHDTTPTSPTPANMPQQRQAGGIEESPERLTPSTDILTEELRKNLLDSLGRDSGDTWHGMPYIISQVSGDSRLLDQMFTAFIHEVLNPALDEEYVVCRRSATSGRREYHAGPPDNQAIEEILTPDKKSHLRSIIDNPESSEDEQNELADAIAEIIRLNGSASMRRILRLITDRSVPSDRKAPHTKAIMLRCRERHHDIVDLGYRQYATVDYLAKHEPVPPEAVLAIISTTAQISPAEILQSVDRKYILVDLLVTLKYLAEQKAVMVEGNQYSRFKQPSVAVSHVPPVITLPPSSTTLKQFTEQTPRGTMRPPASRA
jgi:hypothetical protein